MSPNHHSGGQLTKPSTNAVSFPLLRSILKVLKCYRAWPCGHFVLQSSTDSRSRGVGKVMLGYALQPALTVTVLSNCMFFRVGSVNLTGVCWRHRCCSEVVIICSLKHFYVWRVTQMTSQAILPFSWERIRSISRSSAQRCSGTCQIGFERQERRTLHLLPACLNTVFWRIKLP